MKGYKKKKDIDELSIFSTDSKKMHLLRFGKGYFISYHIVYVIENNTENVFRAMKVL